MKDQWVAVEHHRLHSIEEWPDGPYKDGALAAIRSTLASLARLGAGPVECYICQNREHEHEVDSLPLAA